MKRVMVFAVLAAVMLTSFAWAADEAAKEPAAGEAAVSAPATAADAPAAAPANADAAPAAAPADAAPAAATPGVVTETK